ncbi:MAG TPA: tRNA lysidine(34) synthetase TilS [Bacteroidales bacterium]|nr:MAG: tRNA lysidine(34) synthetase TilS [Bacteroidetes bacterium GWF2_33_38]OFY69063.1 MAG: tRNA lysidine(34) synthetase TilS [Bacteroidetes bacterium RIFOXYA12_FULL_33_9]HBF87244.1 tRNA lysidine(34) synthetase TilS [Bacteroidales bacterium]
MQSSQKYIEKIKKKVARTIVKQNLIQENDRILVGVSGGKDSMVLLDILAKIQKYSPVKFEIIPLHIELQGLYEIDKEYLNKFCEQHKIEMVYKTIEIDFPAWNKTPCFVCSSTRRKALFSSVSEHRCNKLALGHHMDDAIETVLMNMVYHGSISSLPFSLSMFAGEMQLIRPLLEMNKAQIEQYAEIMEFPTEKKLCQHSKETSRSEFSQIISEFEKLNKNARKNIFRSTSKLFPEYFPNIIK